MAAALSLVMYVSNAGVSAGQPQKAVPNLNLTLPPKSDNVDDDNAGVFGEGNGRGANLNIQNVTPEVLAQFMTAPRVRVSIEILE